MTHIKPSRVTKKTTKSSHRRPPHHQHHDSDSKEGASPRVSFLHHHDNDEPYLTIHERFRAVDIKYFKQIFFGTFTPADSPELSRTCINYGTHIPDPSDVLHLARCFEVYCQAIIHYAHPDMLMRLQRALSDYRIHLYELADYYTFESICEYHYCFMTIRMFNGQDNADAWSAEASYKTDTPSTRLLVHKYR